MNGDPELVKYIMTYLKGMLDKYPTMRVMQLLLNAIPNEKHCCNQLYNLEDAELHKYLKEFFERAKEIACKNHK